MYKLKDENLSMKCLIIYQDKEIRMEGIGRFIAKKVIFFNFLIVEG